MTDLSKMFWAACFYDGYITNKDTNELQKLGLIKDFTDFIDPNSLSNAIHSDVSPMLKTKLEQILKHYPVIENKARKYVEDCKATGIFTVTCNDDDYPSYWKLLSGMPRMVFCKGDRKILKTLDQGCCAIVGSRDPSGYALTATADIVKDLVNKQITIVSGMANGIDRQAHLVALNNKGKTIAFLAGGPDNIYPWNNRDIYEMMCRNGLIISEMPPGTKAQRQYFPSRNRLISAISDVCLIMEAGIHSGTLHTASFAAAQGKSVYVLPNTIYSENALGGLRLILDGANILLGSEDVINDIAECSFYRLLGSEPAENRSLMLFSKDPSELNDEDWKKVIINELGTKPQTSDDLSTRINIPFYRLSALLSELEMDGKIEQTRGKFLLTITKH